MKKLILFDIDGTLIDSSRNDRFAQAINNLHKLGVQINKDYRGSTDQLILMALLKDEGWDDQQIAIAMPELVKELDRIHEQSFQKGSIKILPGVHELLRALAKHNVGLGLITGNLESVARRKLQDIKIYSFFSVGGFGSDPHTTRAELIDLAVQRARFKNRKDDVYIIGDTPRDILAAKEAGIVNSVGVANGYRETQELANAGAKLVFEDFTNIPEVISKLNLD